MPPGIIGHGTTDQSVASQLDVSQINDALLGAGTTYFVSLSGNDGNTGLTFDNAFRTIIHAVSVAQSGDIIMVGQGTFDETANGSSGIVISTPRLSIVGLGTSSPFITNSNTTNGGSVVTFAAAGILSNIQNLVLQKGETTSDNAIIAKFDGAFGCDIINSSIIVEKNNFTGIKFTGGSSSCTFGSPYIIGLRSILGSPAGGVGVDFDNSTNCVIVGNIVITAMGVGINFTAPAVVNGAKEGTDITNCVIGAQLNIGVTGNILNNRFTNCGTDIVDNSGNATNFRWGSITHLHDDVEFIPKFPGNIWVVDGTNGLDTNSGHSPIEALQTISAAVTAASAGDAITVRAGTYNEAVNLNKAGLQLWPELGVILTNTAPGVPLTVSANNCVVRRGGLIVSQSGQIGVNITGTGCRLEEIIVTAATIGIDINGANTILLRANISRHTTTGVDISSDGCIIEDIQVVGDGGSQRGFYLSSSAADNNILNTCISTGNGTSGFEAVAGTSGNVIKDSSSGQEDGSPVDNGLNSWPGFEWIEKTERHEDLWPVADGAGTACDPITVTNTATDDTPVSRDDRYYWGDTVSLIDIGDITERWISVGLKIFASVANKIMRFEIYFPQTAYSTTKSGGNDWDLGETALTVSDASVLEIGDKCWITGVDKTDGEIVIIDNIVGSVLTISTEARASLNTGLRYDYDLGGGGETIYVIERDGLPILDGFLGAYSAASTKASARFVWANTKDLAPDSGMIMRMLNVDDDLAASMSVYVIYED